jgi:hypothetical protein
MRKILLSASLFAFLLACTTENKNKHIFHYVITGNSTKAFNLYGKMGPGIEFSSPSVDIPFEVSHEVYGTELEYELRITDTDNSHKYDVQIYVDDKLINHNDTFDNSYNPARVGVKGTFIQ